MAAVYPAGPEPMMTTFLLFAFSMAISSPKLSHCNIYVPLHIERNLVLFRYLYTLGSKTSHRTLLKLNHVRYYDRLKILPDKKKLLKKIPQFGNSLNRCKPRSASSKFALGLITVVF